MKQSFLTLMAFIFIVIGLASCNLNSDVPSHSESVSTSKTLTVRLSNRTNRTVYFKMSAPFSLQSSLKPGEQDVFRSSTKKDITVILSASLRNYGYTDLKGFPFSYGYDRLDQFSVFEDEDLKTLTGY